MDNNKNVKLAQAEFELLVKEMDRKLADLSLKYADKNLSDSDEEGCYDIERQNLLLGFFERVKSIRKKYQIAEPDNQLRNMDF